jgi:hypothetical protein
MQELRMIFYAKYYDYNASCYNLGYNMLRVMLTC